MEISGVQTSSMAASLDAKDTVGVNVLKKAMDIEKQAAQQLIQSIPPAPQGNKGQNINIKV